VNAAPLVVRHPPAPPVVPGPAAEARAVGDRGRARRAVGGTAFFGLALFMFVFHANPGNWFDGLEEVGFAKMAAAFALVALLGAALLYNKSLRLGGRSGWAVVGLFAWVGASALWSVWPKFSLDTATDGLKYLAIFFVTVNVIDEKSRARRFVALLGAAAVIPACGAIWSWAHDEHLVDGDRAGWIGIFANPNDLAFHLAIGVAMVLGARDEASVARRSSVVAALWLVALVPIGIAILLTQSRGGLLGTGGVLAWWLITHARDHRRPTAIAKGVIGVGAALGLIVAIAGGPRWQHRMETSQVAGEDVSARGRLDAWRTGGNIALHRPLTGVGAGAFMIAWPEFAPGDAGPARTGHNTFIQLVGELGFPALGLFIAFLVGAALAARRAARVPALTSQARALQGALIAFTICSLSGGHAFSWPCYLVVGAALGMGELARAARGGAR
jgi:O-antigen ligase